MEKLSSIKTVPGAKMVGNHRPKGLGTGLAWAATLRQAEEGQGGNKERKIRK